MTKKMMLTEEALFEHFGRPKEGDKYYQSFHYAIQPYTCIEEYNRDKQLMDKYSSAGNPQDNFLLAMAAKLERTDKEILGLRV